jgi:DNA polymerase-3 subunit delta
MPPPSTRGRAGGPKGGAARGAATGGGGTLSLATLERELKGERLRRVYLILGDELILRREALERIETAALGSDPNVSAFGRQVFAGAESRASDILAATHGLPMFGSRRLVIVDGVERLRKGDREALLPGIHDVPETSVLVLLADKLDGRLTFTRSLKQKSALIPADGLPEASLPQWISRRFASLGHRVTRDTAERLLLLAGPRLTVLAGEIEKTSLYVGPGRPVRTEDVDRAAAGGLGGTLEDLVTAVSERRLLGALKALADALEVGEEPLRVLGFLTYRITDLWRVADGGRGWPVVNRQARHWNSAELGRAVAALYSADRLLKGAGGGVPLAKRPGERLVLETLLRKIIGAPDERTRPGATSRAASAGQSGSRARQQESLL